MGSRISVGTNRETDEEVKLTMGLWFKIMIKYKD